MIISARVAGRLCRRGNQGSGDRAVAWSRRRDRRSETKARNRLAGANLDRALPGAAGRSAENVVIRRAPVADEQGVFRVSPERSSGGHDGPKQ